jgi:hypothetical protein
MLNKRVAGSDKCGAEKRPSDESAQHKNENRGSPRLGNARHGTEDKREDPRREERLKNHPGHTQRGLTVPKLDVADGQSGKEPAKIPELPEIETCEASRRMNMKMVGTSHLSVPHGDVFFRFDQILTLFELLSRPDQYPLQVFTLRRADFSNRARL